MQLLLLGNELIVGHALKGVFIHAFAQFGRQRLDIADEGSPLGGLLGELGLDGLQLIEGFILQFAFRGVAFDGENFLNESIALGLLFFVDDLLQRRVAGILLDLIAGHAGRFGGGFQRGALLLESRE